MKDAFWYLRLRSADRGWQPLADALRQHTLPRWEADGVRVWGVWQGLFGLASNELLLLVAAPAPEAATAVVDALPAATERVDTLALRATVRPRSLRALPAQGLYVFRFFEVRAADVDEVVALSAEAWQTFERTDRYAARPEGLFRPAEPQPDPGRMLLLTWYDGFASWEASRSPAPEARQNFLRRHALTGGTVALAARMLGELGTPRPPG